MLEQPGNIVVVVGQVEPEAVGDNAVYAYCVDFIGQTSSGGRGGRWGRPVRQRGIDRREPWKRPGQSRGVNRPQLPRRGNRRKLEGLIMMRSDRGEPRERSGIERVSSGI